MKGVQTDVMRATVGQGRGGGGWGVQTDEKYRNVKAVTN